MKLYLTNNATGGLPLERTTEVQDGYYLEGMAAKIASIKKNVGLVYYYDVLGKGKKDVRNSVLKKGRFKPQDS